MRRGTWFAVGACALGTLFAGGARGSVVVTPEQQSGALNTFPVANNDLLQTNLASFATDGSFGSFGGSGPTIGEKFIDGIHGASGAVFDGNNVAPSAGSFITFNLNLVTSPLGYTLSQLDSIASWDRGRDGQEFTVSYATVTAPSTFLSLVTVPAFEGVPSTGVFNDAHSRVRITDTTGTLATGVARLRYTFTSFENSGTAYREIDAFAAPVPEPTSALLLTAVAAGWLGAGRGTRRRRTRPVV